MPRQITKTVFTFKELLEYEKNTDRATKKSWSRAVEKARQWLQEGATDHEWWEYCYEKWQDALDQIGFTDAKISFSGFWSQGDGASFSSGINPERLIDFMASYIQPKDSIDMVPDGKKIHGHDEDFRPWIVKQIDGKRTVPAHRRLLWCINNIDACVRQNSSNYSHERTCSVDIDLLDRKEHKRLDRLFEDWKEDVETLRLDLCKAIYKELEEEYEFRTADEQLIEDAEANDWTFDESGNREG